MRQALGAMGISLAAYGGWLLLSRTDNGQLLDAGIWLVSGVVLHDLVLTGVLLIAGVLSLRLLPESAKAPAVVGMVVLGSLTLVAFPMLGGFGARDDNPTLLDRPYLASWSMLLAVTMVAVIFASLLISRRRDTSGH